MSLVIAASVFLFASTCAATVVRSDGRRRAATAGDGERDEERVRRTRAPAGGGLGLTLPALLLSLPRLRCRARRGGERLGLRLGEREGLLSSSLLDGRVRRARAANGGDTERDGERECMTDPLCSRGGRVARAVCSVALLSAGREGKGREERPFGGQSRATGSGSAAGQSNRASQPHSSGQRGCIEESTRGTPQGLLGVNAPGMSCEERGVRTPPISATGGRLRASEAKVRGQTQTQS